MTIDHAGKAIGRQARYRQIAESLRQQIIAGIYRPGDKLPTELELARRHGVSRVTSAAALTLLERSGLVSRAPRRGTIVKSTAHFAVATAVRPLLAMIQPSIDTGFGVDLLYGIERAAREAGFNMLLCFTDSERSHEEQAIRDAMAAGAAALVLYPQDGETYNAEVLRLVLDGFPVVLLDRHLRGVQCASAESDNVSGARVLVDLLVQRGHRSICTMVFPVTGTSAIEDRLEGYTQALTAAGISIDHSLIFVERGHVGHPVTMISDEKVDRFARFLQQHSHLTAICATNAYLALLASRTVAQLGLRVPDDISLVSIDGLPGVAVDKPNITCALQQGLVLGAKAVQLIQQGLKGLPPSRILVPMRIMDGGTVGPPHQQSPHSAVAS